jgi:hypothetical protein
MTTLAILSAGAQIGSQAGGVAIPWLRIVLAFLFCIAVAAGAIAVLRIKQGQWTMPVWRRGLAARFSIDRASKPRLRVVGRLALAPGHQAVLLRCDDKCHLIHLGPQGSSVIDTFPAVEGTPS